MAFDGIQIGRGPAVVVHIAFIHNRSPPPKSLGQPVSVIEIRKAESMKIFMAERTYAGYQIPFGPVCKHFRSAGIAVYPYPVA